MIGAKQSAQMEVRAPLRIGKNDSIMVCDLTVHRLLMIAAMIAAKFHDDEFYANAYYGKQVIN